MSRRKHHGIVYSTNPDFQYRTDEPSEPETLPPSRQQLRVTLDRKQRAGKTVTLITGFTGKSADLEAIGKMLKVKCGTGGSTKDGEIILQGDFKEKVTDILRKQGFRIT